MTKFITYPVVGTFSGLILGAVGTGILIFVGYLIVNIFTIIRQITAAINTYLDTLDPLGQFIAIGIIMGGITGFLIGIQEASYRRKKS